MRTDGITSVDSEIALTALLAAGVTAFPASSEPINYVVKPIGLGLLVLTLMRRMAVVQGMDPTNRLLQATTHLMDVATFVSVMYLAYVLVKWGSSITGFTGFFPTVFGISTLVLMFGLLIGWELMYKSALRESEEIFDTKAKEHRGEILGLFLSNLAKFVQERRWPEAEKIEQMELDYFNEGFDFDEASREEQIQAVIRFYSNLLVFLIAIAIPLLSYIFLIWFTGILFDSWWVDRFLIFISTLTVSGFIRIWYSKYGIVGERNGFLIFASEGITFLFLSWMVFG